jgi:hypothetical protein
LIERYNLINPSRIELKNEKDIGPENRCGEKGYVRKGAVFFGRTIKIQNYDFNRSSLIKYLNSKATSKTDKLYEGFSFFGIKIGGSSDKRIRGIYNQVVKKAAEEEYSFLMLTGMFCTSVAKCLKEDLIDLSSYSETLGRYLKQPQTIPPDSLTQINCSGHLLIECMTIRQMSFALQFYAFGDDLKRPLFEGRGPTIGSVLAEALKPEENNLLIQEQQKLASSPHQRHRDLASALTPWIEFLKEDAMRQKLACYLPT